VRDEQAFTLEEAVRLITHDTATAWGLYDRGMVREGLNADLVVFDPDTIDQNMPELVNDLPAGAQRLKQTARGISTTVVNGEILLENNRPTAICRDGWCASGQIARSKIIRNQVVAAETVRATAPWLHLVMSRSGFMSGRVMTEFLTATPSARWWLRAVRSAKKRPRGTVEDLRSWSIRTSGDREYDRVVGQIAYDVPPSAG
jgi:hypothetical protein